MKIAELVEQQAALVILWQDGACSRFSFQWLRDNCRCDECGTTVTGARFLQLTEFGPDITPDKCRLTSAGEVALDWSEGGHHSEFDSRWLREQCPAHGTRYSKRTAFDARSTDYPRRDITALDAGDEATIDLAESIYEHGLVLIENVPHTDEAVVDVASTLGGIRPGSYEPVFEIRAQDEPESLAKARCELAPHVDEPYMSDPPGLLLMHCFEESPDGGGASVLVDGLMIGEIIRRDHPDLFRTLCEVPMPHHRYRPGHFDHYGEAPVFTLRGDGQIEGFRFAERSAASLVMTEELIDRVYAARRVLLNLAYDSRYQLRIRLSPGEALLVDNHRLMHGRDDFRGKRYLRQVVVDRDELFSRYRLSCRALGRQAVV